jgi:acetyltransferase
MVVWGFSTLKMMGKGIDLGNACDISYCDALEYFEQDPEVKVIVLHIEGIQDGRKFIDVARRVSRKKPIIALKTGATEKGADAARSHSGSMVGSAAIYKSVFKKCGVLQVDDVDELQDSVKAFLNLPLMKGRNVCLAAITGGGGIVAVDACVKYELQLAELSPKTIERIAKLSPKWLPLRNPVDIWPAIMQAGDDYRSGLRMVIEPLLADVNVDALFVVGFPPYAPDAIASCADVIAELTEIYKDKPLIFFSHLTYTDKFAGIWEKTGRTVFFDAIGRGVKALSQLAQYADFLRSPADDE